MQSMNRKFNSIESEKENERKGKERKGKERKGKERKNRLISYF